MTRFKATVSEDVEANRLMVKSVSEGLIGLSIAQPGDTPEFRSTGKLLEGQEVTVTIKGANSWNIEAGGDIEAGADVGVGDDGKDRKSTRLNSSHVAMPYAVLCWK